MTMPYEVTATRLDGSQRVFTAETQAAAMEAAMRWSIAKEAAVVKAARRLLEIIADARQMLEETDESGATEDAFLALEKALAECAPEQA